MTLAPVEVQAQCQVCATCPGNEHMNINFSQAFTGNLDGEHPCWSLICPSIHDDECDLFGALDAINEADVLATKFVRSLLELYPTHVAWDRSGDWIQVFDCKAERVVAQFEVQPTQ